MNTIRGPSSTPSQAYGVRPMPVLIGMELVESWGGDHLPAHRQEHGELIVPTTGTYRCRLNRVAITVPADGVLVVKPGDWHEDLPGTGTCHYALWFRLGCGEGPSSPLFAEGVLPEQQVVRIAAADLLPLVADLEGECTRCDDASAVIRQGLLEAIIGRVMRVVAAGHLDPGTRQDEDGGTFPERLTALFRRHEARRLEVRTMARDLGMSERHLATVCRARLGISPARAFTAHRMARAAELLAATDLPIKAVADHLGFTNPFHFSRVFHRCHGRTPSAFRARPLAVHRAIGA